MPAKKFVVAEISSSIKVCIFPADTPIYKELVRQLSQIPNIEIVPAPSLSEVDVYLQLGPHSPSTAIKSKKSIVIAPLPTNTQPYQYVVEIISKFIYGYSQNPIPPEPELKVNPTPEAKLVTQSLVLTDRNKYLLKPRFSNKYLLFVLIPLIPWLLLIIQIGILYLFTKCAVVNFNRSCSRSALILSRLISFQTPLAIGSNQLMHNFGYKPENMINIFNYLNEGSENIYNLNYETQSMLSRLKSGGVTQDQIAKIPFLINATNESFAYLQSELKDSFQTINHPPRFFIDLAQNVNSERNKLAKLQIIEQELPKLLGLVKKVSILFLLQDNTELKPSGGYLDSYVLLTVENGQISTIKGTLPQNIDQQLLGVVEPPELYKSVTGKTQWYFTDVNWDPEFSVTAQKIVWLLNKTSTPEIDWVISLNTTFFEEFKPQLKIQEQYLQKLKVNQGDRSQLLVDEFTDILNSLSNMDYQDRVKLSQLIINQLQRRQIFIYPITFSSVAFDRVGWSGGVKLPECTISNCINEMTYIVDTNLSGNNNDQKINRRSQYSIELNQKEIHHTYKLTYQNTSTESSWPTGGYRNFLRLYIPQNQTLEYIYKNGQLIDNNAAYDFLENNFRIVGLLVNTPMNSTDLIEIKTVSKITNDTFRYQLTNLNQPGKPVHPLEITFTFPAHWLVTAYQPPSVASPGSLGYNTTVLAPQQFILDFNQNN